MSSKLTVTDLQLITSELLPAKNKWKGIGFALGLDFDNIEAINDSHTNPQRALRKMLSSVLQMKSLTWALLLDALRKPIVSRDDLANELAIKYDQEDIVAKKQSVSKLKRRKRKHQRQPVSRSKQTSSKKRRPETTDASSSEDDSTDGAPTNEDTESQRLFDEAMKDGSVLLRNINLLLMGAAGSGKSATKDLLLGIPHSEVRNSTPCVRPVINLQIKCSDNKWKEVSEQDLINMLAKAIQDLPQDSRDKLPSDLQARISYTEDSSNATSATPTPPSQESLSPVQQAIKDVITLVIEAMGSTPSQQQASVSSTESKELFGTKTMRVTDSGGQPQFHDVAPLFIRHASAGLFVFRLIDDFADYPNDDLYKDGKPVGPSSPSHLSYLETNMSLLRSFLSYKRDGHTPRPIFVGTFLDQIKDQKVIDKKNQALIDVLPLELKQEVVFSNLLLKQVIFVVDASSRDENAQKASEEIRKAVEDSPTFDLEVPLWWFILELALQKLCDILKRGVLSKSECIALAQQLGFDSSALDAALDYFNATCIVHYYPVILPDIVFVDPQVPLDKVSELTQHAVALRDVTSAKSAKWLKFRDQGILTIDMLASEEFQTYYKDGLFTPADMIAIMRELLIIAPLTIPLLGQVDCLLSKVEFLMPSPSELVQHRVSNPSADPLLIRFVSGCIRCGVFCCLVVFLMKKYGWQVCLPSGKPVLLARNCVKFRLPNEPGAVTLIDSFSCIEVHVKARPNVCPMVCPIIKASVLEGVDAASSALHYNNDKPVINIFCPHEGATQQGKRHFADMHASTKLWRCSEDFELDGDLKPSHTVWLSTPMQPSAIDSPSKGRAEVEPVTKKIKPSDSVADCSKVTPPLPTSSLRTIQASSVPPELTLSVLDKELKTLTKPIQFGVSLGIPQDRLEVIQRDNQNYTEGQKIALFQFIAKNYKTLGITWSNIADALRDIDYGDLSSAVRQEYCTST